MSLGTALSLGIGLGIRIVAHGTMLFDKAQGMAGNGCDGYSKYDICLAEDWSTDR